MHGQHAQSLLPTSYFPLPTFSFLLPTSYFLLPTSFLLVFSSLQHPLNAQLPLPVPAEAGKVATARALRLTFPRYPT